MAFLHFVGATLLLCMTVGSFPITIDGQNVLAPANCDSVSHYTTEWFLQHTLPEYRQEIHKKALFFTRGTSRQAKDLACRSTSLVSLWDIWPEWLYDNSHAETNKMRCIHNDDDQKMTFYENMSRAYARLARRHATIMHSFADYANPPLDGIWGRIELPALQNQTDILSMNKINEDRSQSMTWIIPDKGPRSVYETAIQEAQKLLRLAKDTFSPRAGTGGSCSLWTAEDGALDGLW